MDFDKWLTKILKTVADTFRIQSFIWWAHLNKLGPSKVSTSLTMYHSMKGGLGGSYDFHDKANMMAIYAGIYWQRQPLVRHTLSCFVVTYFTWQGYHVLSAASIPQPDKKTSQKNNQIASVNSPTIHQNLQNVNPYTYLCDRVLTPFFLTIFWERNTKNKVSNIHWRSYCKFKTLL